MQGNKKKMSRNHQTLDRDVYGPDFDNRLIKLVRANPAIYDVRHPNYRRNPIRVQIWDNIAKELGAPSRFLQTKWKNIRYNYLHELKIFNSNTTPQNTNSRRRRYTEDLSFLKFTAQAYVAKRNGQVEACQSMVETQKVNSSSSDNDSNGYMYMDPAVMNHSAFEVIEIEPSDEDEEPVPPTPAYTNEMTGKFRTPSNGGNCGNSSPGAGSSGHHNPYEPSGGSGPDVVTTTNNDLGNGTNWYEDKMDENSLLPPPPEITIEQCRSGNGMGGGNSKMSTIESVIPANSSGQHHHQQQMSLHMSPLMGGGGGSGGGRIGPGGGGVSISANSSGSSSILTPELVYTNGAGGGGSGSVKDLINAEVTIEPITSGSRRMSHPSHSHHQQHHHHHHQQQQQQLQSSSQQALLDNDHRKPPSLSSNNEMPPVLTPINDPIELYCLSLVDCLRAMPRSERERVKFEFAKILKDAVYKDET